MVLAAANPKREVYFQTFDFSIVQKQKTAERVFSIRIVARNSAFEKKFFFSKSRLIFSSLKKKRSNQLYNCTNIVFFLRFNFSTWPKTKTIKEKQREISRAFADRKKIRSDPPLFNCY